MLHTRIKSRILHLEDANDASGAPTPARIAISVGKPVTGWLSKEGPRVVWTDWKIHYFDNFGNEMSVSLIAG